MQVMYEQAKELSKPLKYAAPKHWFELGEITKKRDGTQRLRPKHERYACYPEDIDSFKERPEGCNHQVDDQTNQLAVLLRGAAHINGASHRKTGGWLCLLPPPPFSWEPALRILAVTADMRGFFYLCTLAFELVPARPPYFADYPKAFTIELSYDRLFPLLREAFCSPERYIMQDALLPSFHHLNPAYGPKRSAKYDIGLVRIADPRAIPFEEVMHAKEDLRKLCVVYHPDDGRAFADSPMGSSVFLRGSGEPGAKKAKNK